jgi:hypothetical protein
MTKKSQDDLLQNNSYRFQKKISRMRNLCEIYISADVNTDFKIILELFEKATKNNLKLQNASIINLALMRGGYSIQELSTITDFSVIKNCTHIKAHLEKNFPLWAFVLPEERSYNKLRELVLKFP